MPKHFERLRILLSENADFSVAFYGSIQIDDHPIDLGGQRRVSKSWRDGLCNIVSGGSPWQLANGTVRQSDFDGGSSLDHFWHKRKTFIAMNVQDNAELARLGHSSICRLSIAFALSVFAGLHSFGLLQHCFCAICNHL